MNFEQFEKNIICLFPKMVFKDTLNIDVKKILNIIKNEPFVDSNKHPLDIYLKRSKTFNLLKKYNLINLENKILKSFNVFAKDIMKYKDNDFKITKSWLTKTNINQESNLHRHCNCMFSGVLYLQGDNSKINFEDISLSSFSLKTSEKNIFNSSSFSLNVNENMLLFFPSELYHKVCINEKETKRISLSFDINPIIEENKNES